MWSPFRYEWTQCLSAMAFQTDTQTVQMNIPRGTNCQLIARLFDPEGAYKAMMKGTVLYWLINAFSLCVQSAICQTSAHHWGHEYDLLSYCLPFVLHGLESSVDSMPKVNNFENIRSIKWKWWSGQHKYGISFEHPPLFLRHIVVTC